MHVRLFTLTLFKCLISPYDGAKVLIYAVMCRTSVLVLLNVEFDLSRSFWLPGTDVYCPLLCVHSEIIVNVVVV